MRIKIYTILATIVLNGCASQQHPDHTQTLSFSQAIDVELEKITYSNPGLEKEPELILKQEDPYSGIEWFYDHVCSYMVEEPRPSTYFQIVSVTEKFTPLTGERKAMLFHVKLSPNVP